MVAGGDFGEDLREFLVGKFLGEVGWRGEAGMRGDMLIEVVEGGSADALQHLLDFLFGSGNVVSFGFAREGAGIKRKGAGGSGFSRHINL